MLGFPFPILKSSFRMENTPIFLVPGDAFFPNGRFFLPNGKSTFSEWHFIASQ